MAVDRLHNIDGNKPLFSCNFARLFNLSIEGLHVGIIDDLAILDPVSTLHQVWVVDTEIDAGDGTNGTFFCHGAGKVMGRDSDSHSPLDDGQQLSISELEQR